MSWNCYTDPSTPILECSINSLQAAVFGEQAFALIVSSVLIVAFYVASNGRLGAAAVLTTTVGGLFIGTLPVQYQTTAQIVMFMGLTVGLFAIAQRYVLRGE